MLPCKILMSAFDKLLLQILNSQGSVAQRLMHGMTYNEQ